MSARVIGLDHLGLATNEAKGRLRLWADLLGLPLAKVEAVPSEGVRAWFLNVGGTHLELLEPLGDASPLARFLERRGEGLHHICLRVDDLATVVARLAEQGVAPLEPGVRPGAGGATVAFFHPRDTGGVLLELSERGAPDPDDPSDHTIDSVFGPGAVAVVHLRDPRERRLGVLARLDVVGVAIEGLDVDSWDDWVSQRARGEEGPLAPSLAFFPLSRVEKIVGDTDTPDLPSFQRRFEERTGRPLKRVLQSSSERPAS